MNLTTFPLIATDEASEFIQRTMYYLKNVDNILLKQGQIDVFSFSPMCSVNNVVPPEGVYTICHSRKMNFEINAFDHFNYHGEIIKISRSIIEENKDRILTVWTKYSGSVINRSGLYFL